MFKTKVFLNRVPTDWQTDLNKAKEYFKRKGVEMDFDFVQYDYKDLSFVEVNLYPQGRRVFVQPYMANVLPVDKSYDFTIFAFNQEEFPTHGMPQGMCYEHINGIFIDVGFHRNNPKDLSYVEICHELMHGLVKKARKAGFIVDDVMDSYYNNFFLETENSNFGQQWKLLKPYLDSIKPGFKYFQPHEVQGLNPKLVAMLDKAREIAGIPFVINSGLRSGNHNESVGGKEDSSHLKGLAVDLRARNSTEHYLITKGLYGAGFRRISRSYPTHIHTDIDSDKAQDVLF